MHISRRISAEAIGTFCLVFAGCGSAVTSTAIPGLGVGLVNVSLAFGLSVMTMAYAFGYISGAHFNPAVTVGLWIAGRFPGRDILPYVAAQLAGAIAAATLLLLVAQGAPDYELARAGLGENGYGPRSPGYYSLGSCFLTEFVLTALFLLVVLGVTDGRARGGLAPIAIGLTLTFVHLVGIPVTGTSVNPARSTGPALLVGWPAFAQLWLFWIAPMTGAATAALFHRFLFVAPPAFPATASSMQQARDGRF